MKPLSISGRLILVVTSVVIALAAMEIALRLTGIGSDQFLQQDPVLGLRYIPSKKGLNQGECYRSDVTTNSHGWRSRETTWDKPSNTFRIVVIGDSFMGALQVEDDQTFSAVLESALNQEGLFKQVEVINLGVPSFGTDQEYLALREFGKKYDPDVVVLAFYAQNDVKNNSIALERRDSAYPKPYFEMRDGELIEVPYHDPTPGWIALTRQFVQPLRLYPWARDTLMNIPFVHHILYWAGIVGNVPQEESRDEHSHQYPKWWERQSTVFRRDYNEEWLKAWEITKAIIYKTRREASEIGSEFLLLGVADPISILPESVKQEVFSAELNSNLDMDKPAEIVSEFAASESIEFFNLVPVFRSRIGQREEALAHHYLLCDGHWTVAGNRLAAEAAAAHLVPVLKQKIAK